MIDRSRAAALTDLVRSTNATAATGRT